ncbi:NH(3)-dependent NAD(+) synthetase [Williamsoniiplasma somnilux]|uniref:NH(3)-dependent NAD(+) synthetase n=1 Tax=Williamsoniiplasma somnilux TaxID=215578 RepID=A0A2K8P1M7_9MOLU|nr:NAD(+) synthase [Williamsoniiplasma somnilux]ATZ18813.1 NH(3)-dependent NAD(+) synthetase [Williamsoniiplasma somnilux]
MELKSYIDYLVNFIRETVQKANADGVIVGISGGIDSAVVANLAKLAFPNNYLTVWMPINSSKEDLDCVQELISQNNLNSTTVELALTFNTLKSDLEKTNIELSKLSLANSKARLRMTTLYALGQAQNYLVLGTDNMDEWHIGYFTKFGDGGVDIVPLIHLLKSEVRAAAKILNVPESIINRKPTAGLWENQTDEQEIGFSYDEIDDYLLGKPSSNLLIEKIDYLHKISEHKRNSAIQPKEYQRKK